MVTGNATLAHNGNDAGTVMRPMSSLYFDLLPAKTYFKEHIKSTTIRCAGLNYCGGRYDKDQKP